MSKQDYAGDLGDMSVNDFADAIATYGNEITINGIGEPGIGKTASMGRLKKVFGTDDYHYHIFDMGRMDVGDLALPTVTKIEGVTVSKFVPNADFGSQFKGKKVCIMFDEIYKAPKPVLNAVASFLQDRRLNDWVAPEGSIVFCASNLETDGCGDKPQPFIKRRTVRVGVEKPRAGLNPLNNEIEPDSWGSWAIDNGIDPLIIYFVKENPNCLDSYTKGHDNKMIFNPAREPSVEAFVCPYTLEMASKIIKKSDKVSERVLRGMLKGAIGTYASQTLLALKKFADKMPSWNKIVTDPANAPLPKQEDVAVKFMVVTKALTLLDENIIDSLVTYFKRYDPEYEGVFYRSVMTSKEKQEIAIDCDAFTKRATEMKWLFT